MDRLRSLGRCFFPRPASEQEIKMGNLGSKQQVVESKPAPAPRASFLSGRWFDVGSLRLRFPECLKPTMPRALVQWRAKAAFQEALKHIEGATPLGNAPVDFSKAVKSFERFHALAADAPDRGQLLKQIAKEGFAGRKMLDRATLLSHLKPGGEFYQALQQAGQKVPGGSGGLQTLCDEVANAAESGFNSARRFKA